LKGRRDRIPAGEEREAGIGKSRKKYLIFYLEQKVKNINFVVPKVKKDPLKLRLRRRQFFEIME
jgi:hypothetical protein